MYRFHYGIMKPTFPKLQLCFTDTDSFLYHIETCDLYSQLANIKQYFDFSNYPCDHTLFSLEGKAQVGLFKDETGGMPIVEFCGLRSKVYSLITVDGIQKNAAAGVKKCVAKKSLSHELYRKVLFGERDEEDFMIQQKSFRSYNHTIFTVDTYKVGLSRYDDKRFILQDGVATLPHGHFKTRI